MMMIDHDLALHQFAMEIANAVVLHYRINGNGDTTLGPDTVAKFVVDCAFEIETPRTLEELRKVQQQLDAALAKLNAPELLSFRDGVVTEAAHQRDRWSAQHDGDKTPLDWFWVIGYLAQKAAYAQIANDTEKALHHTISTAAAMANWHAQILERSGMKPAVGAVSTAQDAKKGSPSPWGDADVLDDLALEEIFEEYDRAASNSVSQTQARRELAELLIEGTERPRGPMLLVDGQENAE